jgi:hypothetical protein
MKPEKETVFRGFPTIVYSISQAQHQAVKKPGGAG